jgi:hypothetical protein
MISDRNISVRAIENGYIVSVYTHSGSQEWYCIDIHEITRRIEDLL